MRSRRLELPRGFPHKHLKLARLPFRHDRPGQAPGYSGWPLLLQSPRLRGLAAHAVLGFAQRPMPLPAAEWCTAEGLTPYADAVAFMQDRVAAIRSGTAAELVWLVEHPPLYTAGTSARREELTEPDRFPTFQAGRGGQWTYHGPGQRVAYVMLDLLRSHGAVPPRDVRCFVH